MSKTKKWSIIASVLSTLTAGGVGGVAYTQGYFGGGDTEHAAAGEGETGAAAPEGTTDNTDPTTAASELADAGRADAETTPISNDPFARMGSASMAAEYSAADTTSYEPAPNGADAAVAGDIPSAAAAFAGIEPVDLEPPAEVADPVGMTDAAIADAAMDDTAMDDTAMDDTAMDDTAAGELTPPVDPRAMTDDPALLPVPDANQPAAYREDSYLKESYAQTPPPNQYADDQQGNGQYGTGQYGTGQYGNHQNENAQYGDDRDVDGLAPAALAAGLGAAGGALAADAIGDANTQGAPNDNTLVRDGNPYRRRYGEPSGDSTTPTAAAPATPLDAGSTAGSNTDDYQAEPNAAVTQSSAIDSSADQQSFDQHPPSGQVGESTDPTTSDARRQGEYAFTRPAGKTTHPVAPLAPVADAKSRGPYAQSAAASGVETTNSAAQFGAAGTSVGSAEESYTGVGVAGSGAGQPGPAQMEGMQQASVSIEKRAPLEAQVGREAIWEIFVRNTGDVTAQVVEVHDDVPYGATLTRTHPQAQAIDGHIVWSLGSLEPGEERRLEMEIVPQVEGDMGSVARVVVGTEATARATVTKPQLQIEAAAPEEVLIGSLARLVIKVSNVGTGVAHAVRLEEHVPELFEHPGGERLIYEVGDLGPKQVRELDLMLTAAKAGVTDNRLTVRATGDFTAEKTNRVEVVAPKLEVHFAGPTKRYLQRDGTFTLTLNNPGTATALDVQLAAHVPDGLEFVDANNSGYYDPTTRTVHWLLAELPPQQPAEVKLSARAVKEGVHPLLVESTTPLGLRAELAQPIEVEGLAAVSFEVRDLQDPVEVGGRTAYEIRVINQGSKAANNVTISAVIPPTMRAIDAAGPTRHTVESGRVVFDPLSRLAPRADTTFTIEVEAVRAGDSDSRLRVELTSDETTTPITRDEPTVVFSDE